MLTESSRLQKSDGMLMMTTGSRASKCDESCRSRNGLLWKIMLVSLVAAVVVVASVSTTGSSSFSSSSWVGTQTHLEKSSIRADCKRRRLAMSAKSDVLDGTQVSEEEFAEKWNFIAALEIDSTTYNKKSTCSAIIMRRKWVLTAGHCCAYHPTEQELKDYETGDMTVLVGSDDLQCDVVEKIGVEKILRHDDYQLSPPRNDLCLLKLKKNIAEAWTDIEDNVPTIPTNKQFADIPTNLDFGGYGHISYDSTTKTNKESDDLYKGEFKKSDCKGLEAYFGVSYDDLIKDKGIFCAAADASRKSTPCAGDSGGPVLESGTKNLWGVISFGASENCVAAEHAITWTTFFATWVKDTMDKNR